MGERLLEVLSTTVSGFIDALLAFLPRLLSMLVILVVGVVAALVARRVVTWLARVLRLGRALERTGAGAALAKVGVDKPDALLGTVALWLTLVAFALLALQAAGIGGAETLAADLIRFLPRLLAAMVVVLIGFGIANFLWRLVLLAAVNMRIEGAPLLAALVRVMVLLASVAIGLDQVGIGAQVVQTGFAITFGAVMLAGALAFGLGGRHVARRYLEEKLLAKKPRDDEPSHL